MNDKQRTEMKFYYKVLPMLLALVSYNMIEWLYLLGLVMSRLWMTMMTESEICDLWMTTDLALGLEIEKHRA